MRKRKQEGFSLIELLIVVAIILIIAAIAIPNLMRSKANANESGGAASIRTLITDSITYQSTYPTAGYPATISVLSSPAGGCAAPAPNSTNACLADNVLACAAQPCAKDNYQYTITGIGAGGAAANTDFVAFGTPSGPNQGNKDYCASSEGVVRFQSSKGAAPTAAINTVAACSALAPI